MGPICFRLAIFACLAWVSALAARGETFLGFELLQLDGVRVRWGNSETGATPVVTYSMVDRRQTFADARNCAELDPVETALSSSNIGLDSFRTEMKAAFAMWAKVANIEFREVERGQPANILIGAQGQPSGYAFTDVHYTSGDDTVHRIDRSLICLNPERHWKIGFDGNLLVYDLRYTIAHEIGHAIGLDHPSASGQLMSFRYDEHFRQLQPGDIQGATKIYGISTLKYQKSEAELRLGSQSATMAPAVAASICYFVICGSVLA